MPERTNIFINREISWLSFNDRVLQEAADTSVPLLERLKFLGIFSSNMDEFFRVRVATLRRMIDLDEGSKSVLGGKPRKILHDIQEIVLEHRNRFDKIYEEVLAGLEKENVFIINEIQLSDTQGDFVRSYFQEKVRPTLVPVMLDSAPSFPILKDREIYFAILLHNGDASGHAKHALMELSTDVISRFLVLPKEGDKTYIILVDDVIRYCLKEIFSIVDVYNYKHIEAYTIKLTRDAELDLDDDISESFMLKLSKGLKLRKKGKLVRFIYDENMPEEMLRFLTRRMKLKKEDNMIPGARYHNFKDFIRFPKVGGSHLRSPERQPLPHKEISPNQSLLKLMRKKDILLSFPFQSFHYVIDLLREAAIDPQVVSIKMTLYRVAENSNVVNALINAARNGKSVTVVVELQARFDEEANIYWANKLREEGASVKFGIQGMKVHSKICLIDRKEKNSMVKYAYVGTGNFNEGTALIYSDHGLLTANPNITEELAQVFGFLENSLKPGIYKHILVSPHFMRSSFFGMIHKETVNAKAGKPAYIVLKLNSLVDTEMINKLYEASDAGVKIFLIIRSICSLKAGVKGLSENIYAISIVDKYLEHSRIFLFCNGGKEKLYIGSGDWMTRNLDYRVEVDCPIYDAQIRNTLKTFLAVQMSDNTKARILDPEQKNEYRRNEGQHIRTQDTFYQILQSELGHSAVHLDLKMPDALMHVAIEKPIKAPRAKKTTKI